MILADSGVDPVNGFAAYGPLGLIVLGFLFGKIVPGYQYDRVEKENDRLREVVERMLPALEKSNEVTTRALELMNGLEPQPPARRRRAPE